MKREQGAAGDLLLKIARLEEENERLRTNYSGYLKILAASEAISRIIVEADDLDMMLHKVLQELLTIFACDRAWLLYPCDPNALTYRIPMECTRDEWPGANVEGIDIPVDEDARQVFNMALEAGVVCIDPDTNASFLQEDIFQRFNIRSQIFMAIHPRMGKPWLLGIHHCAAPVNYTPGDCDLFKTLGNRISDGLSNLISWQNSLQLFENTEIAIRDEDISEICMEFQKLRDVGIEDLRSHLE